MSQQHFHNVLCVFMSLKWIMLNIHLYSNMILATLASLWSETSNLMTINRCHICFQTNTLDAVLLLLRDLDEEDLRVVHTATQNRLQTFTVDSEVFDSLQTEKSFVIQQWNALLRPNDLWTRVCYVLLWSLFWQFLLVWGAQIWAWFYDFYSDLNSETHQNGGVPPVQGCHTSMYILHLPLIIHLAAMLCRRVLEN